MVLLAIVLLYLSGMTDHLFEESFDDFQWPNEIQNSNEAEVGSFILSALLNSIFMMVLGGNDETADWKTEICRKTDRWLIFQRGTTTF